MNIGTPRASERAGRFRLTIRGAAGKCAAFRAARRLPSHPPQDFRRAPVRPIEDRFQDVMANTPQAKKRIRRNERRAAINGARISRIRTLVKKVEAALATGDKEAAATALQTVQPELARGVARGVLHKNTAARKFGRLTKAVSALG